MGIIEQDARQMLYRRLRREEERRRQRERIVLTLAAFLLYALLAAVALRADDAPPPKIEVHCARHSGVNPPTVRCAVTRADTFDTFSVEWRLYGESDDAITDFETKNDFRFEAPTSWRLIEVRIKSDDGRAKRLRAWVRWQGRDVEFRQYGREGE